MTSDQLRFLKDMAEMIKSEGVGIIREVFEGRANYCGPAVVVAPPDRQLVNDYTELVLKAEASGSNLILYPA